MPKPFTSLVVALGIVATLGVTSFAQEETPAVNVEIDVADPLDNPAVAAVLEQDRTTPAEQLQVVATLVDLGYPSVAEPILQEIVVANLSEEKLVSLADRFGSARLVRLVRQSRDPGIKASPKFQKAAATLVQSILDATDSRARDPERIASLIAKLSDESDAVRRQTRSDLSVGGEPAIVACFNALAATEEEDLRAQLLATLALMRHAVESPTLAVLARGKGLVQRDAAELAGHLRMKDALPYLSLFSIQGDEVPASQAARAALAKFGLPMPSPAEAFELARRDLAASRQGPPPVALSIDEEGPWWTWNAKTKTLSKQQLPARMLRIKSASRLARVLNLGGMPPAADLRETMLLIAAEEAGLSDTDVPEDLKQWFDSLSIAELNTMLARAVKQEYHAAAVKIAETLGERGDLSAISSYHGRPTALASAVASPDRGVKFAALQAIMKIAPGQRFPGSSAVAPALWYFATGGGEPVAVVGGSTIDHANAWAGALRAAGYDTSPATNGRSVLLSAFDVAQTSRMNLVVLDANLDRPRMREVLYQLRRDPRTAQVPIAVVSPGERLREMEPLAATVPQVLVEPRPSGTAAVKGLVSRLTKLASSPFPDAKERAAQAKYALETIAKLLKEGHAYDELIRDSEVVSSTLYDPALTAASLAVLENLGTQASQLALVDYASSETQPAEGRQAALAAFTASHNRFGLQLTRTQIIRQYDRYNASEISSEETQMILGSILDVLEGRAAKPQAVSGTKP
ncbi:MAG: hypothetical protein RH917_03130 [Lacipirellulaceae bacterium]